MSIFKTALLCAAVVTLSYSPTWAQDEPAGQERQRPRMGMRDRGTTPGQAGEWAGRRPGMDRMSTDPEVRARMRERMAERMGESTGPMMRQRMRPGEGASSAANESTGPRAGMSRRGEAGGAVEIGSAAPDFHVTDAEGKPHSLADQRGKIVVLEWTNPGCPYVQRHYTKGTMKELAQKYKGQDVVWMAVDTTTGNTPEKSAEWAKKNELSYPILIDKDGSMARAYSARTTPHMFIIDKSGNLVYQGAIDDDPNGNKGEQAINYVDKALAKLTTGGQPEVSTTQPYGCGVKFPN
jgi:peroxiredoxin